MDRVRQNFKFLSSIKASKSKSNLIRSASTENIKALIEVFINLDPSSLSSSESKFLIRNKKFLKKLTAAKLLPVLKKKLEKDFATTKKLLIIGLNQIIEQSTVSLYQSE